MKELRDLQDTIELPPIQYNDSEVIRDTLRFYGGWFGVFLLVFCYVRRRFPRLYNIRSWVEHLKTPLAEDQFGYFSWMWKIFFISDYEMLDECGMDALCFLRAIEFGLRLSLFALLQSFWLIPIYKTAKEDDETKTVADPIVEISVSDIPPGSKRFIATVVAAYIIFGFTMYGILKEFEWFARFRHRFLSKNLARNYTVYVQCIPEAYRTNSALRRFFERTLAHQAVLDVHQVVKVDRLKKKVEERKDVLASLEHAINVEAVTGVTPTHRTMIISGESVSEIDQLFEQLRELNRQIRDAIEKIEHRQDPNRTIIRDTATTTTTPVSNAIVVVTEPDKGLDTSNPKSKGGPVVAFDPLLGKSESPEQRTIQSDDSKNHLSTQQSIGKSETPEQQTVQTEENKNSVMDDIVEVTTQSINSILYGGKDGTPYGAAFVTFKTLKATQAAMQILQDPTPFAMEVGEAPDPEDVFWYNTGKGHKQVQTGKVLSFALTAVLCLFWTVPMTTINTLSTIEGLTGSVPFVADLLEAFPWLEPVLAQLAPLLVVAATELLKVVLEALSMFEGPVSGAVVQASLFRKLAAFTIIQTFFISAISGTLISEISEILQQPGLAIDLLGRALPARSTFFIQVVLVKTFFSMAFELTKLTPLLMASIRRIIGWNLTDKEQNMTMFGFLRPLSDPTEFMHALYLSYVILDFMVFFVYSTLAPICNLFLVICFLVKSIGYRHQFIYNYPTKPDSGGRLWIKFIGLMPVCMLIAQFTIVGELSLKKTYTASVMMTPLIIITVLFTIYIHQRHFHVIQYLPASESLVTDDRNRKDGRTMDYGFVRGKYIQPELLVKELLPENASPEREMELGIEYATPANSEIDADEMTTLTA